MYSPQYRPHVSLVRDPPQATPAHQCSNASPGHLRPYLERRAGGDLLRLRMLRRGGVRERDLDLE